MELRRYCPLVQEILFAVQEASQLRDKGSAPVRPTGPQDALQIEFSMFTIARKRFTVTLPHFFEVAKCCSVHLHCCTVSNICLIPSLSFTIPCKPPDSRDDPIVSSLLQRDILQSRHRAKTNNPKPKEPPETRIQSMNELINKKINRNLQLLLRSSILTAKTSSSSSSLSLSLELEL
jgi:hypothetical protein